MSHYDTLSVSRTAPVEVIRGAYKALSQKHHPDKGGDAATMASINEAWYWLSDPDRREAHDMQLSYIDAMAGAEAPRRKPKPEAPKPERPRGSPLEIDEELIKQMKNPSPSMLKAKGSPSFGLFSAGLFGS